MSVHGRLWADIFRLFPRFPLDGTISLCYARIYAHATMFESRDEDHVFF